jgi:hypothetical protein
MPSSSDTTSAFFYGTLLHPEVIRRVIGNTGDHLQVAPAILLDFTRHHVKACISRSTALQVELHPFACLS